MPPYATSPLILAPFGPGTPAEATAPPEKQPLEARFVDPRSKDWKLAPDGSYRRMPRTRHRVLVAVSTIRGSASVLLEHGIRIPRKIGADYQRRMRIEVERALRFLVRDGSIELNDVITETVSGRVTTRILYTDLATGEQDEQTI